MANPFDQFDKAPRPAAVAAPMTAGPAVEAAPQASPFDQFDKQRTAAPEKSEWDVDWNKARKNALSRANYSAYGTIGDVIGMAAQPIYSTIDAVAGTDLGKRYAEAKPILGPEWLAERVVTLPAASAVDRQEIAQVCSLIRHAGRDRPLEPAE